MAESVGLGDLLHLRTGVGDGQKVAASLVGSHGLLHLGEEILLENVGFQCRTGFAGHYHQRLGEIDLVASGLDLHRISGVNDVQGREASLLAEGHGKHFGAKARSAHAQQQHGLESGSLHVGGKGGKGCQLFLAAFDDVDPAQPGFFALAGPEAGVLLPEAGNLVVGGPVGGSQINGAAKLCGKFELEAHVVFNSA